MEEVGPELLSRLVAEHGAALVLYARSCASGPGAVAPEDIVQEAFLKLVRSEVPPQSVVPWLYRVVRNAAISQARSSSRRSRREAAAARRESWFERERSGAIDADAATEALRALVEEEREVIIMRLWGKLSFDEIADATGASRSTAHRRYVAGLESLRERLGVACPREKNSP